jgi:high-affinity nickel permease
MNLLQVAKMSDEVTVSSLPHPISMFFLGIFGVTIVFILTEVIRFKKDNEKFKSLAEEINKKLEVSTSELEQKLSDVSKKIDSRVDKALISFKKQNKIVE